MSDKKIQIRFQELIAKRDGAPDYGIFTISRAAVPGGWLVTYDTGICFLPDPDHEGDGESLS